MTASNWRTCPACARKLRQEIGIASQALDDSYGIVDRAEWDILVKDQRDLLAFELKPNLREDYQIGIAEDGTFFVNYNADCQAVGCNFKYNYAISESTNTSES